MWKRNDPTEPKLITYLGELPDRLYRYRPLSAKTLDRVVDFEIIEEAIYLAGLKDLNDPDEGRFRIVFGGTRSELLGYWREAMKSSKPEMTAPEIEATANANVDELIGNGYRVPDRVVTYTRNVLEHVLRVACFTTQPVNYSMWANYAKYDSPGAGSIGHGGICIEYRCDEGWRHTGLHPVEYTNAVPEINVVLRSEAELVKAMYTKAREWRCEEEWRLMSILQVDPPFPENFAANSRIKLENGVASVIFGLNTPSELVNEIRSRIASAKPQVTFKRVVRDPVTFNRTLLELK